MTMKAVSKKSSVGKEENNFIIPDDDGVVMVMFPKQTWNRVQEMADKYGKRSAEILMLALELFSDNMEGK